MQVESGDRSSWISPLEFFPAAPHNTGAIQVAMRRSFVRTTIDPRAHEWATVERLIVFDGICNWAYAWIDLTMARDRGRFHFATLQSDKGAAVAPAVGIAQAGLRNVSPVRAGTGVREIHRGPENRQTTVGLLAATLPPHPGPSPLRDRLYDYVARHRYRLMGKAQTCRAPTAHERSRFL